MLPLLLLACAPDPPPPVEVQAQTLSLQLDNLVLQEPLAELVCRCDASHDGMAELMDKVSTDLKESVPVPVQTQMHGDTLTLELGAASLQNPYLGPEHMLHTPVCEAELLLLLTSPEYEDIVFGLTRDLLSPPTPGQAAITHRAALTGIEARFEAEGGWVVHRSQAMVDVSGPIAGELVAVDGVPVLRVDGQDYALPYRAPHLLQHLGPLTGEGVLSADTVYWSRFEVMPYSFQTQAVGAARVDRRKDPPQIEVQGVPWETRLLNPDAFPEGIWTGKIVYHLVGRYGDLHMQHGVYAYRSR